MHKKTFLASCGAVSASAALPAIAQAQQVSPSTVVFEAKPSQIKETT